MLTSYNGQSITYDGAGNPLTYRDGMQFTWELGRQLKTAACNGKTYTYKYNSDGLRTQKTDGTVTTDFYWANGNLTYQDDGTNELYFCYDDAGAPVSVNINGTDYYYVKNLQGDIIALLDGQGVCVVKYTYDAWGKILEIEDNTENNIGAINPLRYRGYYYDSETGFYYLRSRYYDPTVGRFLNADDIAYLGANGTVVSHNLFAYCENDRVNNSDYSGKTTYKNSYYHYSNRYVITTIITHNNNKYTYRYKARRADGTIQFYFSANNYGIALEKGFAKLLAKAMLKKVKEINPRLLSDRTESGIHAELFAHYIGYKTAWYIRNFNPADMGDFAVDGNARVFESMKFGFTMYKMQKAIQGISYRGYRYSTLWRYWRYR